MSELADLLERYQRSLNHPKPKTYLWRSWVDGPRGILAELMRGATNYGLRLTVENHDRRWFRETVVFEVRSNDKAQLEAFRAAVAEWTKP